MPPVEATSDIVKVRLSDSYSGFSVMPDFAM